MSYVVLARKWRPQSFEDLVGQEHVSTTIANAIHRDRVAHAFLFTGVRGVGKTTSARILAKSLNCIKGPTPTPCQTCPACLEITSGTDVDVQEIDGASYTGVDDVRKLQESMPYRPQRDRFKIFIVDEVHMLSMNAWNAFLKTLEEPPPHVKFIFATTEVHKVPVTILSRCQRYDFKLISAQAIATRLRFVLGEEKIAAEDAAVATIAREAAGSMRDAMSLLDQVIAWVGTSGDKLTAEGVARVLGVADRQVLHRLAAALVDGDPAACVHIIGELAQEGYDIPHLAKSILAHLRDLAVAKVCEEPQKLLDLADEEIAEVKALAERAEADDLVRLHQGFSKAFDDIVRGGQPRASLEMTLIRLARRPPLVPIDELLRRLADLERRLGGGGGGGGAGPAGPAGAGPGRGAGGGAAPPPGRRPAPGGGGARASGVEGEMSAAGEERGDAPRAPEQRAPEQRAPEQRAPEQRAAEAPRVAETKPAVEAGRPAETRPTFEAPRSSDGPRATEQRATFEAPRSSDGPRATEQRATFEAPRSSDGPRATEQRATFEAPRSSDGRPTEQRATFEAPRAAEQKPAFEAPRAPESRGPESRPAATSQPTRPTFEGRPSFEGPPSSGPRFVAPGPPAARPVSTPPPSLEGVPVSRPGVAPKALDIGARAAPAPPTRPASEEEIATWRRIIEGVRLRRPALASVLAHAQIFDMGAERVTLAYEATSFLYAQATDNSSKDLLTAVIRAHFGAQTELVFEIAVGKTGTAIADIDAMIRKAKQDAARREVAEHPLVMAAIRTLGAELIDVRLVEVAEA